MPVHVRKEPFAIQLKLVALGIQILVSLQKSAEQFSELVQPGLLKKSQLFHGQIRNRFHALYSSSWFESGKPFTKSYGSVTICVKNLNQARNVAQRNTVVFEDLSDFISGYSSILIDIEQIERVLQRECLVRKEGHTSIL